jgi:hypothetical protein
MSLKDIGGAMTYKDLDIGDWIIFKSEEGKEVVSVITDINLIALIFSSVPVN